MRKIYAIFFFICNGTVAQQSLRLSDAINIALKNSFDIQLAKSNDQINVVRNNYGVAGGLPVVSGTASNNEQSTTLNQKLSNGTVTDKNGVSANSLAAGLNGSILLYNGMGVIATKHELEHLQTQGEQLLNAEIQSVIDTVMVEYYDVVRQQTYMRTLDASIAASMERLGIVKAQQAVGMANNADLYQSQLDLNALLQSKQSQQLVIDQAKAAFLSTLVLNPDSTISIEDTILVDTTVSLGEVLDNLEQNPQVIAATEQIRINEFIEKQTAAQRYPSLRLNAGYSYNRSQSAAGFTLLNQTYGPQVGLSLSVPIYNGSIYKRQQRVAEINTKIAEIEKKDLLNYYQSYAVTNYQAYRNSLQQLEVQKENYILAQKLLDLVLQKYQLRNATIVDVRNAQQTFENAGYLLVNLNYAAKSAEIELKLLMNKLSF